MNFRKLWESYLKEDSDSAFEAYYAASLLHIGWQYEYKGIVVNMPNKAKEEAFFAAYDEFEKQLGEWNVIEDDITFKPLF